MARAKHTDRSAARRRHRQELTAQSAPADEGDDTAAAATEEGAKRPVRTADPARPGIMWALRSSFHPLDIRADLRTAPVTLLGPAVLLAALAAIVSSAVFILASSDLGKSLDFTQADPYAGKAFDSASNLSFLVVGFFVTPPPAAGAFLVGFFAKRASWLGGLAIGVVAALCYSAILISPAGRLLIRDSAPEPYVFQAMVLAPLGAVLFASAAAWYRRFLNLANPNRGQRPNRQAGKAKPKPAAGRTASRR